MKKLLVLLLSVIMLLSVIPAIGVSAAKEPKFVISSAKGDVGDQVKITVSTKENTGIVSMKLLVRYDESALKLTDAQEGKFKNVAFSSQENTPFIINWIDAISPNNKTNGTVATLTFEILDTAPEGKSEISLTYDPEDVFDINFNNVTFGIENGYVDITNPNAPAESTSSVDSQEQQISDSTDSSNDAQTNSNVPDSTHSQILEQIYDSANKDNNSQNDVSDNSNTTGDNSSNGWIIWVVVAAVVVLGGAFAIVIIKSKKEK